MKDAGTIVCEVDAILKIGETHHPGDCVDGWQGFDLRTCVRFRGALDEKEVGQRRTMAGSLLEIDTEFVIGAVDAVAFFGGFSQVVEALAPELEPSCDRRDAQCRGGRLGLEEADVIGDDGESAAAETCDDGRFSGA